MKNSQNTPNSSQDKPLESQPQVIAASIDTQSKPRRIARFIKVLLIFLAGVVVLVLGLIASMYLRHEIDQRNKKQEYQAQVERCGGKPIAKVVRTDFYGWKKTEIITPENAQYDDEVQDTGFISDAQEYYCTLSEAGVDPYSETQDFSTAQNLSAESQRILATRSLDAYAIKHVMAFLQPGDIPERLSDHKLLVSGVNYTDDNSPPYDISYLDKVGKEVIFSCGDAQGKTNFASPNLIYTEEVVVSSTEQRVESSGQSYIYKIKSANYGKDSKGLQIWRLTYDVYSAGGSGFGACSMVDTHGVLTLDEGNKMIRGVVPLQTDSYSTLLFLN